LKPILLVFSIFVLMRGHNAPGGGFVGGLLAASAFVLQMVAFSSAEARRHLKLEPYLFFAVGLLFALSSGVISLFYGEAFLTGHWVKFDLPLLGVTKLGTPVLFDLGVYFTVLGAVLFIFLPLKDE
jgi:multicomponent Na+:H+ antiporter subunit B